MQNEAQYDLDRKAAKMSALSSNNLDKHECLTGEELGLRPNTVEQLKFEYSPLGRVFNELLEVKEKKEGLFKRLKNIEGKSEEQLPAIEDEEKKQLDAIKDINIGSKPLRTISFFSLINEKAKKLMEKIMIINDWLDPAQLICTKNDRKTKYDFRKFVVVILHWRKQKLIKKNLEILKNKLNNDYNPQSLEKIKGKKGHLKLHKKIALYQVENY